MCSFFCGVVCVRQGFLHFIPFDLRYKVQISWGQGQMIAFFKRERIYFLHIVPPVFNRFKSYPGFQSLKLLKVIKV